MTDLAVAPADAVVPAEGARAAATLASRIKVPRRLPPRYDGQPLRHLSASSYSLWVTCPEAWRIRYLQGRKGPTSGAMFLGSRIDDALSLYYRRILEHRERLELAQVKDAYRDLWHTEFQAEEEEKLGVDWSDIHQHAAFEVGLQALELTFEQLEPKLGEPLAVQRRIEFALAPGLVEWTVVCYLDLETRGCGLTGGGDAARRRLQGQDKPDQPAEGRPRLAGKPVPRRPLARGPDGSAGR